MSRYGVYVSGSASRIRSFLRDDSNVGVDIAFVLSDAPRNEDLRALCASREIPLVELDYAAVGVRGSAKNDALSARYLRLLEDTSCGHGIVFGTRLLVGELLTAFRHRLINFHPSILPAFPGLSAIDAAMSQNAFLLGNTAFFIDEGVDSGPVIMQSLIHRSNFTGYDSVLDLQVTMLRQIIAWIDAGRLVVDGGRVRVLEADYSIGPFVPAIEVGG